MLYANFDGGRGLFLRQFDILLPVFNAYEEVRECLSTLLRHTDPRHEIFLLDDASTDPRLRELFLQLEPRHPQLRVVSRNQNVGFLKNVNAGLKQTTNDVVLLNSDILVGKDWLPRLERALESRPNVGIVSPLFSFAYFLSFPHILVENEIPVGHSFDSFAEKLAERSPRHYPVIPAGLGCCMLITQAVLKTVGYLDEAFSPGYWEDVDFSMKARKKGFEIVCADDVYVYHHCGKSFGHNNVRNRLIARNENMARAFWPTFHQDVDRFVAAAPFREHRKRLGV